MSTATMVKRYAYADLSDEAKVQARKVLTGEMHRGGWQEGSLQQLWDTSLWEDVQHNIKDDVEQHYGLGEFELHYDLSFCQGSGIGFSGSMDAIAITHEEWLPILALLGANCERHRVGTVTVSWSHPITDMTVVIRNDRQNPWFHDNYLELTVTYADGEIEDDLDQQNPIFQAVAAYFRKVTNDLYTAYSSELLDGTDNEDRVEGFFEWQDEVRFCEHGYRIDEMDDDEIEEMENEHV